MTDAPSRPYPDNESALSQLAIRLEREPLSYHKFSPVEFGVLLKALKDFNREHRRYLDASRNADTHRKERDIWKTAAQAEAALGKELLARAEQAEADLQRLRPYADAFRQSRSVADMEKCFTEIEGRGAVAQPPQERQVALDSDGKPVYFSQASSVPDGYALVPLIPTARMIEIGCDNNPTMWNDGTPDGFAADVANDVYVSMVRACAVSSTTLGSAADE